MNIRGRLVLLRAVDREDLPLLHQWSNDPEVQYWLGGWHFPSSNAVMEDWFQRIKSDERNQRFAIDINGQGLIGTANLADINWKDRNAFLGIMLGPVDARGRGYGVDAVMALARYAFCELGFERLDTTIIEYNEASKKLFLEKCGWKLEGTRKNWYFRKNRLWDKLIVGINKEDYLALVARTGYWDK